MKTLFLTVEMPSGNKTKGDPYRFCLKNVPQIPLNTS